MKATVALYKFMYRDGTVTHDTNVMEVRTRSSDDDFHWLQVSEPVTVELTMLPDDVIEALRQSKIRTRTVDKVAALEAEIAKLRASA